MQASPNPHYRHRFPAEIISHAVWLYHVFSLSFRDVELILSERGVIVSYETIRRWSIALQFVGDDHAWLVLQPFQQALKEALGGFAIAAFLHQNIKHDALLVNRAPEIMQCPIDADEDLVEVPLITRLRTPAAQVLSKVLTELQARRKAGSVAKRRASPKPVPQQSS